MYRFLRDVGQILVFISVTNYVVGSVSYSFDMWPPWGGPAGVTHHMAGSREGAAGGPRPPVRPQPPGAPHHLEHPLDTRKNHSLLV